MKQVLTNIFDDQETLYQPWPQINLLHPNSINLICDGSSIYGNDNSINNASIASAVVFYDQYSNNFVTYALEPISIRSNSNNLSEEVSLLVGLENLYASGIKQPNHNVLNVFTDSTFVIRKFLPLFNNVKNLRFRRTPPDDIIHSMDYCTDLEQLVVCYLVWLNMIPSLYHLKAHTNNLGYIIKDFKINNSISVNEEELIYLTSVQAMVDSLATKTAKNII